jgi:transposase-like protein
MTKQPASETNGIPHGSGTPSPEVQPSVERRPRSAAEKLRILQEYDSYPVGSPERGALLRREGIYTSQISKWRKRHAGGGVQALRAQPRGPKPAQQDILQVEVKRLRKENARLQARLAQAETIIDVQKNVAQLLGTTLPPTPVDEP